MQQLSKKGRLLDSLDAIRRLRKLALFVPLGTGVNEFRQSSLDSG
jgi:hypothetical protein